MKRINSTHAKTHQKRKQIITAALKCFTESGVADTSMNAICKRSKASIGSIYHHFKSKEQLAAAVYLDGIKDYQDGYIDVLEKQTDAKEGIARVIEYHLNWVVDHPDWSRYLFKERHATFLGENKQIFEQLNKGFYKRAAGWFKPHIRAGTFKKLPSDIFVSILMGPCQVFSSQYLFDQTYSDIKHACVEIANAVWNALKKDNS
jgi:AcrR family transcriptional regulator